MPHGLTREAIGERLAKRGPVWVRPLAESNKGRKPLRVLDVAGHYAVLEQEINGRKRQCRIALDKLEYAKDPEAKVLHEVKPAPVYPRPERDVTITIAESKPPEPPAPPAPPPPPPPAPIPVVVEARREWKGPMRWVVMHGDTHRFYTETHRWDAAIENARQYDTSAGANKGAGRLRGPGGRCKGQPIVAVTLPEAHAKLELLAKKAAAPPPPPKAEPPPPPPPPAPVAPAVVVAAPAPAAPDVALAAAVAAWESALRAEHAAFAELSARKVAVAAAQLDIDIVTARRRLGLA